MLRSMIRLALALAFCVGALIYAGGVQGSPAAPGPQAQPATFVGCTATVGAEHDGLRVQARGRVTAWDNHEPGFEIAELNGTLDQWGTGPVVISTTHPPLEFKDVRDCRWSGPPDRCPPDPYECSPELCEDPEAPCRTGTAAELPAPLVIEPDPGDLEPCAWWQNGSQRTIPWGYYPWWADQVCQWNTQYGYRWFIIRIYIRY